MALDFILVQNFYLQMEAMEKMSLFLELIRAHLCMLMIREKIPKGPTQGLYDTTLTVEAKYPINFKQSEKIFVLSLR